MTEFVSSNYHDNYNRGYHDGLLGRRYREGFGGPHWPKHMISALPGACLTGESRVAYRDGYQDGLGGRYGA